MRAGCTPSGRTGSHGGFGLGLGACLGTGFGLGFGAGLGVDTGGLGVPIRGVVPRLAGRGGAGAIVAEVVAVVVAVVVSVVVITSSVVVVAASRVGMSAGLRRVSSATGERQGGGRGECQQR